MVGLADKYSYFKIRFAREAKRVVKDLTPPFIAKAIAGGKPDRGSTDNAFLYQNRIDMCDKSPSSVEYIVGLPVLSIPVEHARYTGGISYLNDMHHMRRFYRDSREALSKFYKSHQPTDIFEKHFLKSTRPNLPKDGLPWFESNAQNEAKVEKGEKGLMAEGHGLQHYGPVSEQKLSMEVDRLSSVLRSIERKGFVPDYGFPRGYFLENDKGEWVFHIMGGQHRVAAMTFLKHKEIYVQIKPFTKRVIRLSDIGNWPMVRDGLLSEEEAKAIFDCYFPLKRQIKYVKHKQKN